MVWILLFNMEKKGVLLVFLTALISGVSIFVNSFGVKGVDSTVFTFAKNFIVAILLICIIFGLREFNNLKRLSTRDWLWLLLIGLIGGAVPFVLFFKGLQLSSGALGSFVHKTMFVFVAVLALIFLKERIKLKVVIPAALLLAGNFLLLKMGSFKFDLAVLL